MKLPRLIGLGLALLTQVWAMELETHTVEGNEKTFGADFSILRPKDWVERSPKTGGVVAGFYATPHGPGDNMTLVVPSRQRVSPVPVTKAEFKEFFDHPMMEKAIAAAMPSAKVKITGKQWLPDHKYPAGYVEYDAIMPTPTGEIPVQVRTYIVYLEKVMVQVQFYRLSEDGSDRRKAFEPEMRRIMASLEMIKK